MPRFELERTVPYPREPVFDLVADIESYPEFLPGWRSARILRRDGAHLLVEQRLGRGALGWTFRTQAALERPDRIVIQSRESPFAHLDQQWHFRATEDGGTRVRLTVDYALRSRWAERFANALFDEAFHRTLAAFEARARERLG